MTPLGVPVSEHERAERVCARGESFRPFCFRVGERATSISLLLSFFFASSVPLENHSRRPLFSALSIAEALLLCPRVEEFALAERNASEGSLALPTHTSAAKRIANATHPTPPPFDSSARRCLVPLVLWFSAPLPTP